MSNAMREMREYERQQGRQEGLQEGHQQGRQEATLETQTHAIRAIMTSFDVDAEEAMDVLQIPEGERGLYRDELAKARASVS